MHALIRSLSTLSALCLFVSGGFTGTLHAQSAKAVAAATRVVAAVEPGETVRLRGHIPPWANAGNDLGAVAGDLQLNNLHLILSRAPQVQAAFEKLLADQQDPSSPRYHQWLTPQQNAEQYGIAPSDLAAVTTWLRSQGLSVDDVAAGGVFITFSGPASAVQAAFGTQLHNFSHANLSLYAPTAEPSVPAAIAGVIASVAGLDDTRMKPHNIHRFVSSTDAAGTAQPFVNSSTAGVHYIGPGDWNTIYDAAPVLSGGVTGANTKVLILDYGRVLAADITSFETFFGLSTTTQPNTILLAGSADPGYDGINGWQAEGTLDVQRVLGTAPGAAIDYFIAATSSYANTFSQLQYNISTLNDPIVSMSFGSCEVNGSSATPTQFDSYFSTGAAQGIGNYVSSGDTGAAGCDANGSAAPATQHLAPNVVCASGFATCVGGTEFSETAANAATYWAATNNATTKASALSYIPEGAWNEPSYVNSSGVTAYAPASSGGGVSFNITKPTWQTGVGVPADGFRDTPDMSFTSAGGHDGYVVCILQGNCGSQGFYVFGGTSAAAPSMAGVAALLNSKLGKAQGNLNPLLYRLAASPTNNVFHDITVATSGVTGCTTATPSMCNNSTPAPAALTGGLAGYALTAGYDQVTGLGSIDVNNLLIAAIATSTVNTTLAVTAATNPAPAGSSLVLTATLTPGTSTNTPTGTVQFYSNGVAIGTPQTIASNKATLSFTFTPAGTYAITAIYSGDSNFATSTAPAYSLVISAAATFSVIPAAGTLSVISGATTGNTVSISLASLNTFAGTVSLGCTVTNTSGTAAGACTLTPPSVALTSGSSATSTLTVSTTVGTSGVLNVTVTGTSGSTVVTSTAVAVTLVAPGFTIAPAVSSLTVKSGSTTGNTALVTLTSTNGFAGPVNITCSIDTIVPPTGLITSTNTSCSPVPSVTLTAGGSATTTVTVTSTLGGGGTFNAIINGIGTTTGATLAATSSASLPVVVTAPNFTLTVALNPATQSTTVVPGATLTYTATLTSVNGYVGPVTIACTGVNRSGTAAATCASQTATLTAGGITTANLSFVTTAGTSGTIVANFVASGTSTGASYPAPVATATSAVITLLAPSATTLTVPATIVTTQTATLSATVTGTGATPTGTVQFLDGTTVLNTASLTAGVASFTASGLSVGTHNITAAYSGDGTFAPSVSSVGTIVVTPAPVFTVSASAATPATITAGASATSTVTVTSVSGPAPAVTLSCAVTPAASIPPICSLSPATLTPAAGGTATSTVTISTVAPHAVNNGLQTGNRPADRPPTRSTATTIALCSLFLLGLPFAGRRRNWRALAVLLVLGGAFLGLSGCSGGGTAPAPAKTGGTTTGSYTVTITATAPGGTTQTSTFAVTVQ